MDFTFSLNYNISFYNNKFISNYTNINSAALFQYSLKYLRTSSKRIHFLQFLLIGILFYTNNNINPYLTSYMDNLITILIIFKF